MIDMEKAKTELKRRVLASMPAAGDYPTAINSVALHRRDAVKSPENCLYVPRIVLMVQGRKRSMVGQYEYFYGEDDVFVNGVDLPNTSSMIEASPENPCMSITIDLDKNLIAQLGMEMTTAGGGDTDSFAGLLVQPAEANMVGAFLRLMELLDEPDQIAVLAPMIIKEIHFRVLIGPNGNQLRLLYTYGSHKNQIARAISWIRENFKERLLVDSLAEKVHMTSSTFHRHFKDITTLSPLQFQKRLRLHEAQRLMLMDNLDAYGACEAVGYESLTQFNREYKRLFGDPPKRNVLRWQRENANSLALMPGE